MGWRVSNELEKKLRLLYPRSQVQKFVDVFGERKFVLQTLEVLRSSHTSRNVTRRACPGWLSRGRGAALGQGPPREEPQRPLPPAPLGSAFMHVYFQVCTQMCGLLGGAGRREAKVAVQNVLSRSHRDPEETSLLFRASQTAVRWIVSSGTGRGLCRHGALSPRTATVMPCRLIGSLGGAAGRRGKPWVAIGGPHCPWCTSQGAQPSR